MEEGANRLAITICALIILASLLIPSSLFSSSMIAQVESTQETHVECDGPSPPDFIEPRILGRYSNNTVLDVEMCFWKDWVISSYRFETQIFELSETGTLTHVSEIEFGGGYNGVEIHNGYLWVLGADGIAIYDMTNMSCPSQISVFGYSNIREMAFSGDYLYCARSSRIYVYDISNVLDPTLIEQYDGSDLDRPYIYQPRNLVIKDGYLYYTDVNSGLEVIDISDPSDLRGVVSAINTGSEGMCLKDSYLYVAGNVRGLNTVDISDPCNPVIVGNLPGYAMSIAIEGRYAFLQSLWEELRIVDISNPFSPTIVNSWEDGGIENAHVYRSFLFTENPAYTQVFDVSDVLSPVKTDEILTSGGTYRLNLHNDSAQILGASGVHSLNISNPRNMYELNRIYYGESGRDILFQDEIAFICTNYEGLIIQNFSDPCSPQEIAVYKYKSSPYPRRMYLDGQLLHLLDWQGYIDTINISDVSNPNLTNQYSAPYEFFDGYYDDIDNLLHTVSREGFQIFNLTIDDSPSLVGEYNYSGGWGSRLTKVGDYVYVADGYGEVKIIDVTAPTNPSELTEIGVFGDSLSLDIQDDVLYVLTTADYLELYNISDLMSISLIHSFDIGVRLKDIRTRNNLTYVLTEFSGLWVVDAGFDSDTDGLTDGWEEYYGSDFDPSSDTDSDTLTNLEEFDANSNPLLGDTDGDSIGDADEVNIHLTNPSSADSDGDHLDDFAEIYIHNSDPNQDDSDSDGIMDHAEIYTYSTNHTLSDSDLDELLDGEEVYLFKTDPSDDDSDGDQMHDGWEIQYALDPLSSEDADSDLDCDGLTNLNEFLLNTIPNSIDSDDDSFHDDYEVVYGSDPLDSLDFPKIWQTDFDELALYLDGNATLMNMVIGWLEGNSSEIEELYSYLDGNATLLYRTVNNLERNSTLIQDLLSWSDGNASLINTIVSQLESNSTLILHVLDWLDGNSSEIEQLFTLLEGNATLLVDVMRGLESNATLIEITNALATDNAEDIASLNVTITQEDIDAIQDVLDQLGVSIGDTDYDGLDDLTEISLGTSIVSIDTDADNLIDAFEVKIGTDPLNDDSDGDEYYDGYEIMLGTDPLDANSYPRETNPPDMILISAGGLVGIIAVATIIAAIRRRVKE